jgi:hypothetical protein
MADDELERRRGESILSVGVGEEGEGDDCSHVKWLLFELFGRGDDVYLSLTSLLGKQESANKLFLTFSFPFLSEV